MDAESVNILPPEVWQLILENLIDEPIQLTKCRIVSTVWRDIIDRIFELKPPNWRQLCEKHVPTFYIQQTFCEIHREKFTKSVLLKNMKMREAVNIDTARNIYVNWKFFQINHELSESVGVPKTIGNNSLQLSVTEQITCMDLFDDTVALGTSKGSIFFYCIKDLQNPFFVAQHCKVVTEIQQSTDYISDDSIDTENSIKFIYVAASTCSDGHVKYWDVLNKREIASDQHLGRHLGFSYVPELSQFYCTSYWNGILSIYKITPNLVEHKRHCKLPGVKRENKKVVLVNDVSATVLDIQSNELEVYRCYLNSSHNCPPAVLRKKVPLPEEVASNVEKNFFLFLDNIVCLTFDRIACLSVLGNDSWVVHNGIERFDANITSINCTFDKRVLIGLDNGKIHMFRHSKRIVWEVDPLSVEKEVETLDVSETVLFMETSSVDKHQDYYIVAATAHTLNVFTRSTDQEDEEHPLRLL